MKWSIHLALSALVADYLIITWLYPPRLHPLVALSIIPYRITTHLYGLYIHRALPPSLLPRMSDDDDFMMDDAGDDEDYDFEYEDDGDDAEGGDIGEDGVDLENSYYMAKCEWDSVSH